MKWWSRARHLHCLASSGQAGNRREQYRRQHRCVAPARAARRKSSVTLVAAKGPLYRHTVANHRLRELRVGGDFLLLHTTPSGTCLVKACCLEKWEMAWRQTFDANPAPRMPLLLPLLAAANAMLMMPDA